MVKTYDSRQPGTVKVFVVVKDERITSIIIGNQTVATERGYQFYVVDYVADQIDKFDITFDGYIPILDLKEGEELIVPVKSEKQLEIERLRRELEALEEDPEEENAE